MIVDYSSARRLALLVVRVRISLAYVDPFQSPNPVKL
jgi:hypothetical protein